MKRIRKIRMKWKKRREAMKQGGEVSAVAVCGWLSRPRRSRILRLSMGQFRGMRPSRMSRILYLILQLYETYLFLVVIHTSRATGVCTERPAGGVYQCAAVLIASCRAQCQKGASHRSSSQRIRPRVSASRGEFRCEAEVVRRRSATPTVA